jgi:D-alanyl-D-alanine carboxypeptidase
MLCLTFRLSWPSGSRLSATKEPILPSCEDVYCVKRKRHHTSAEPRGVADNIPVAQRTHPRGPGTHNTSNQRVQPFLLFCLLGFSVLGLSVLARRGGSLFPAQESGLQARVSSDGRLLGHFPYPEADPQAMVSIRPGLLLRPEAAERFIEMERAAAAAGVVLVPLSTFRPRSVQNKLFFDVKADRNQSSIDRARVSAPPGFSEHSTGYAIDIGDESQPQANLSPMFSETKAYRWLRDNAARFQYILSFPENNPQGVNFEPWHWRYEGNTEALRLFEPAQRLVRQRSGQQQP